MNNTNDHTPTADAVGSASARCDDNHAPRHEDAIGYFNMLVLDLQLQLLGHADKMSAPLTSDRLREADTHLLSLYGCRERVMHSRAPTRLLPDHPMPNDTADRGCVPFQQNNQPVGAAAAPDEARVKQPDLEDRR